ncbi:MAG: hypothetical protein AAB424_02305 [Patescibacteria group bacterium]
MFLSTHALAGIIISQHVHSVPAAFGLGLLSHYILDMIPHGDEKLGAWVKAKLIRRFALTFLTDLGFLALFVYTVHVTGDWPNPNVALAAIIGAVLPDLIWVAYDAYRMLLIKHFPRATKIIQDVTRLESFFNHHDRLHRWFHAYIEKRLTFKVGLAVQVVLAGALLFVSTR